MDEHGQRETERREVRAADPSLSPEANRMLTDELREAVGSDEVELPVGRRHVERERHGRHSGVAVVLATNRLLVALTCVRQACEHAYVSRRA